MGIILTTLVEHLGFFESLVATQVMHGAHLSTATLFHRFVADDMVERLEVFLPSEAMLDEGALAHAADALLPAHRRGVGFLRFYPVHSLPDVWGDGAERILFCVDPEMMARHRYLRDRFATGPTPMIADTHTLGHHSFWEFIRRLCAAPPVAYDTILCRTNSTEAALREGFHIYGDDRPAPCRLDRLAYPVDTELFHPQTEEGKQDARRLLGLPLEGTLVLYLGRVTAHSKADLYPLLACFAEAAEPHDRLLIAGNEYPEGYGSALKDEGDNLGLGDRLIVHGKVAPVLRPLYYAAADLFVLPGDCVIEAFGNTVSEAMASGLPVIVSDWDGLRDHVVHGETGLLIPTRFMPGLDRIEAMSPVSRVITDHHYLAQSVWVDTAALTRALRDLLGLPELRRQMGRAGRTRAEQLYSWEVLRPRWHQLWDALLALARSEPSEAATLRKEVAAELANPTPYLRLFGQYATEVWDPRETFIRLSERGWRVARGELTLTFNDGTLPVVKSSLVNALTQLLSAPLTTWILMEEVAERAARMAGESPSDALFHLGLWFKRGLLEAQPASASSP